MLVDSHAHLDFNKLSSNFSKIIENAIENTDQLQTMELNTEDPNEKHENTDDV